MSFVRYADDIAIFRASEREAARVAERVIAWIERELKLPVNRDKSGHGPGTGTSLTGVRLEADGTIRSASRPKARSGSRRRSARGAATG